MRGQGEGAGGGGRGGRGGISIQVAGRGRRDWEWGGGHDHGWRTACVACVLCHVPQAPCICRCAACRQEISRRCMCTGGHSRERIDAVHLQAISAEDLESPLSPRIHEPGPGRVRCAAILVQDVVWLKLGRLKRQRIIWSEPPPPAVVHLRVSAFAQSKHDCCAPRLGCHHNTHRGMLRRRTGAGLYVCGGGGMNAWGPCCSYALHACACESQCHASHRTERA